MKRVYDGTSNMNVSDKEKHPTRKILEQGGVVDGEDFEMMLREEAKLNKMDTLESIEENLIQLNRTMYEILKAISNNQQG